MSHEATSRQKRIQELREAREKSEVAQREKLEEGELVKLELWERFTKAGGTEHVDFEIIDTPDGFIVVKLGEWVHLKKFRAAKQINGLPELEAVAAFAVENLAYPDREKFFAITNKFGDVATRCANEIVRMHQGQRREYEGK